MASVLSWFGNAVHRVAHDVNNDVVKPVQRDVVQPVAHFVNQDVVQPVAQRVNAAVAQVNPLDSGRTYNTVMQRGAGYVPHPNQSLFQQATHNGLTNFGGDLVKPLFRTGMAVNQGIGNLELKLAGRPTENAQQFFGPQLTNFSGYTGTKRQIAGDLANTALTVAAPGISRGVEGAFSSVVPDVVPKLVTRTVANAGSGAIVGAPFNVASYVASDQPITKQGLEQNAIQGAQFGAVLGAGGTLAGPVAGAVGRQGARVATKGAQTAVRNVKASTPTAVIHKTLLTDNPEYAQLQSQLEQSTAAANKINREGGSKVALNQHQKNIQDIQRQMYEMRRAASQKGSLNPNYGDLGAPEGSSLPKGTAKGSPTGESASSASRAASSKPSVPEPSKPAVVPEGQGQTVYHGTDKASYDNITGKGIVPGTKKEINLGKVMMSKSDVVRKFGNEHGFSVSRNPEVAKGYGEHVVPLYIDPSAKIATAKDFPEVFKQFEDGKYFNMKDAIELAKNNGYDGIDVHSFEVKTPKPSKNEEIQIFNTKVLKTKDQLAPQPAQAAKVSAQTHQPVKKTVLGKVKGAAARAAKKAFGLDTSSYNHTIDNYAVQHAMRDPSITAEDIANIPNIIDTPDHIYNGGKTKQGLDTLVYHKKIGGHNYYVEEVRTGKGELAMKTLNKKKNPDTQRSDEVLYTSPKLTTERSGQSSLSIVPKTGLKVKPALPAPEKPKGVILKEGPIQNGRRDVVRAVFNPETRRLEQRTESIVAPGHESLSASELASLDQKSREMGPHEASAPESTLPSPTTPRRTTPTPAGTVRLSGERSGGQTAAQTGSNTGRLVGPSEPRTQKPSLANDIPDLLDEVQSSKLNVKQKVALHDNALQPQDTKQLTDLYNQAHAEAKTPVVKSGAKLQAKTTSPREMGRALGLSDKQMTAASRAEREQQQVSQGLSSHLPLKEASEPKTPVTSSEALPKNRQNPSARKVSSVKSGSSGGKYTTNATKVNIADVKPGDYEKVRSNAQLVQTVVHNHAQSVIHALRKLPDKERANFWHSVENPKLPRSPEMQTAIDRWHRLADTVHATGKSLGGDTPYLANYARHNWDLSDPAQRDLYEQLLKQKVSDTNYNPDMFRGLDNKPRLFSTIKEGQAAGFKLKNAKPIDDIVDYANKSKRQLKTQAVAKGMQEAEENIPLADKSETQTIGYKKSIETTKQGVKELRALFPPEKSTNKALKGYRALNHGAKRFLLGISQFHPVNINMQAAPALALRGHPIRAVRGLIDSAAALNKKYSDKIMENALKDGTLEDAGRIGTPIATGSDFATGNKVDLKAGFGERAVFERQLPAMHIQMVRGVVSDLKKRGISLDSPEARKAGTEINQIMGYVNTELRNLSPTVQRGLGDVALAPQFTRSKWEVLGDAFNPKNAGTLQGKYARDAVVGKYAAEAGITLALGALLGQKSDNIKDTLIRTLIHPAVPTPFKDKKGNTIELGLPQNYVSEAAGLGLNYTRGANGHLNITASPSGIPGNLNQYGKNRLALVPNDALKVVTNTDFADKPLYDPNASTGTKIAQGATTLLTGHLPIGAQGLAYTKAVNKHLPQSVQEVLNNASPGSNPILKSVGSSFGLNPRTDKTVGKGLSTTRYFDALDNAKKGLNSRELAAIGLNTDSKKNPVTGKYNVTPNVNDSRAKAAALLDQPKAFNALYKMNQSLAKHGEKVDPLWRQSADKVKSYLAYQAMAPGSADKSDWYNKNKSWYQPVAAARSTFFNNLPPGDPNKPQLASEFTYPTKPKAVNDYYNLKSSNPTAANAFFDNHPEIAKYEDQYAQVTNNWRTSQGYAPFKNYPKASPDVQSFMDNYNAADKAARKSIRNANPTQYRKMIAYYDALDLYNINKQGALGQLQGEPDYTDKSAKAIKNIGEDFYVDQNGNYHLIPAGWMLGLGGDGYGSNGSSSANAAAKLKFDLARKPLKIVGSLPAPTKLAAPKFVSPALKKVYQKQGVNTRPTVSVTKTKRLA